MDSDDCRKKELKEGGFMGREMDSFAGGAFGCIYEDAHSHLLVKQLGYENDNGSELAEEYRIADYLGMTLPSFVAAPFALMRGVSSRDYEEKLSFVQQRVHGKTFNDLSFGDFTHKELFSLLMQCMEFVLRLGGAFVILDMHCGNVMVDTRVPGAPCIKFIDFGRWFSADPSNGSKYDEMLQNLLFAKRPMKELLLMMGFNHEAVWARWMHNLNENDVLLELPSRIYSDWPEAVHSEEFKVVQKLCSIRYVQKNKNEKIGVISEFVDLSLG
jgi:hypothetical protein